MTISEITGKEIRTFDDISKDVISSANEIGELTEHIEKSRTALHITILNHKNYVAELVEAGNNK